MIPRNTILQGDVMDVLPTLPEGFVQTVVTSPPYWGLRDYGTAEWEGGDPACEHVGKRSTGRSTLKNDGRPNPGILENHKVPGVPFKEVCALCGARRIDRQLGLEPTPEEFIERMVAVFREVRRVLREDGTCWLNMGDAYASSSATTGGYSDKSTLQGYTSENTKGRQMSRSDTHRTVNHGLKPKDLVGMPWRLALALQADGWWLRCDIIWAKPNPMPESVTDRPTKSHEYLFLLTKRPRYFYDADAVREAHSDKPHVRGKQKANSTDGMNMADGWKHLPVFHNPSGRNLRSVWSIPTQAYPEAHFATFPERLVEPCIKAGTSHKACPTCGGPWERVVERGDIVCTGGGGNMKASHERIGYMEQRQRNTTGFRPTCSCPGNDGSARCIVLDPFMGSGTVGQVARRLKRDWLGAELNPEYIELAYNRILGKDPGPETREMPAGGKATQQVLL